MITSSQNSKIKLVRALMGRAKERREAGAFVAEGVRLVEEALISNWRLEIVLYDETLGERGRELLKTLGAKRIDVEEVSTGVMKSISETETPQGILAVLKNYQSFDTLRTALPILRQAQDGVAKRPAFILIPDQIRDPGNLGTLLRSAAAAGVDAVLIPPETTDAFAPKVLRSGMGAHFRLPIREMSWDEIVKITSGLNVYVADMDGQPCWEMDLTGPVALIVGSEAEGASESARRLAKGKIGIPMSGETESLNAGVAGSVLMFEVMRQRAVNSE